MKLYKNLPYLLKFLILILSFLIFLKINSFATVKYRCQEMYDEIIRLAYQDFKIEEAIIKRITFKLCENQPDLEGISPKYLLEGSDGNLYLFKIPEQNKYNEIEANILSSLLGKILLI